MLRATLLLTILAVVLSGCSNRRYFYLATEEWPPTPPDQEIRLYVNPLVRPHVEVAHVQSFKDTETDSETRRRQLAQMRETARSLGADAIMDIRQMEGEVRGLVIDEMVPFRAYRQGRYPLYFLRGTAVRFAEEEEEVTPIDDPRRRPIVPGLEDEELEDPGEIPGLPEPEVDEEELMPAPPPGIGPGTL